MDRNLLILLSDEHNKRMLGVSGHEFVKTPNLDKLAKDGSFFENAYCNSPICVPSRAILATGRYNAEIGYWDNADPYDGKIISWGHRVVDASCDAVSIGKLHFVDDQAPTGFSEQINPLNVVGGVGDRDPSADRNIVKCVGDIRRYAVICAIEGQISEVGSDQ